MDTKVHVFKFPKDQTLRDAWIRAVPREDLSVTENSRVSFLFGRELIVSLQMEIQYMYTFE